MCSLRVEEQLSDYTVEFDCCCKVIARTFRLYTGRTFCTYSSDCTDTTTQKADACAHKLACKLDVDWLWHASGLVHKSAQCLANSYCDVQLYLLSYC